MKINELWLKEMVQTSLTAEQIGAELTMAGLELDGIEAVAGEFDQVVVAEIVEIAPHPDADKLRVCQVTSGAETHQVVCGAANAKQGLKTALAKVGAKLPSGMKIKKAKLRGVESFGMLCSGSELGMDDDSDGIMDLPADAEVGSALFDYLKLDDHILELDLTPNRADCFSVLGVARDLAAVEKSSFQEPSIEPLKASSSATFPVSVSATEDCPVYAGRVIEGVNAAAQTPLWLKERLRRCGLRSLGPVVDVTNYVMLELGQPLHAFDRDKLNAGITVRLAQQDEKLALLDASTVELRTDTLVIADDSGPVALAGIMGGLSTSVTDATTNLFLESAYFAPLPIAGKARSYGLHTDSSMRYERGVDFSQQERAIERASQLIVDICGGSAGPVEKQVAKNQLEAIQPIQLSYDAVARHLGISLEPTDINAMFERLGCLVESSTDGCVVSPPAWRFDLRIPVDLIEEVARLYGYDNIPMATSSWERPLKPTHEAMLPINHLREILLNSGFNEAITYSFVDQKTEQALATGFEPVALLNPISADLSQMRTTLIGGLLNATLYNVRRQQQDVRFFETGLVFRQRDGQLDQTRKLAMVITGAKEQEHWSGSSNSIDFYDMKGAVEQLLQAGRHHQTCIWTRAEESMLHPGQSASLRIDDQDVGFLGTLHPAVAKEFGFKQSVFVAELNLDCLLEGELTSFHALSKFPSVRRDLAIVIDENTSYDEVVKSIQSVDEEILRSSHIFDLYTGEGVKKGLKSIALGLILQDFSRTLDEQEIEAVVSKITTKLQQDLDASIRE